MHRPATTHRIPVRDYNLAATLCSGQTFRWTEIDGAWEGVIGRRWVKLQHLNDTMFATVAEPTADWTWLTNYLQSDVDLDRVIAEFPHDTVLQEAVESCRGLRLLRQPPWECLASFILSSTKQIKQIQQVVKRLCERYGDPVPVLPNCVTEWQTFPSADCVAQIPEEELRACGMGFRAPYLKAAACAVESGRLNLGALQQLPIREAREALMELPGVGRKIADCVLLFTGAQPTAFPVDVWIMKALQQLYFSGRKTPLRSLQAFTETHFGPRAGYAQQYLFHYMRIHRPHVHNSH